MPKLTNEIIIAAIEGYSAQKARIDAKIAELRALLPGGSAEPAATPEPTNRRKKFSAATRRRMKEAQRLRWAKIRGESEPPAPAKLKPAKPKRKLSAAAKAKLVANLKKARAAKAARAKAAAKNSAPARKKTAVKKVVTKKAAAKKTAPAAATETAGQ